MTDHDQPPVVVRTNGGIVSIAGDAIGAIKTLPPVLLLIVLLNMAFAGAGAFYLIHVEDLRGRDRTALVELLEKCTMHTVPIEALPYFKGKEI